MGKEIEIKFAARDANQLRAVLNDAKCRAAQAQPEKVIAMRTRYYDTPERELSAMHWTLRTRQEGADPVITLKTPGKDSCERGEWNLSRTDTGAPSQRELEQLVQLGAPAQAITPLQLDMICGARFTRTCLRLLLADGTDVELAADEGELLGPTMSQPFCEIELELYGGNPEEMLRFARRLAFAHGMQEEPKSKFARARELD